MASLTIGNCGEVFYIDETSEITWDTYGMPTMHGFPQIDLLTRHLYTYYQMTGVMLLPTSQARLPPQRVQGHASH